MPPQTGPLFLPGPEPCSSAWRCPTVSLRDETGRDDSRSTGRKAKAETNEEHPTDCLNMLRFPGSITKLLQNAGMPLEEIPGFQQQIREDVVSKDMRVYHPRKPFAPPPSSPPPPNHLLGPWSGISAPACPFFRAWLTDSLFFFINVQCTSSMGENRRPRPRK